MKAGLASCQGEAARVSGSPRVLGVDTLGGEASGARERGGAEGGKCREGKKGRERAEEGSV
jgi:hypothetical protein